MNKAINLLLSRSQKIKDVQKNKTKGVCFVTTGSGEGFPCLANEQNRI